MSCAHLRKCTWYFNHTIHNCMFETFHCNSKNCAIRSKIAEFSNSSFWFEHRVGKSTVLGMWTVRASLPGLLHQFLIADCKLSKLKTRSLGNKAGVWLGEVHSNKYYTFKCTNQRAEINAFWLDDILGIKALVNLVSMPPLASFTNPSSNDN